MPTTYYTNANGMILGERTGIGPHIDYIPDALGSVVAAVDQNLVTTYTAAYSPFGDVIASTGTAPNLTWVGTLGYLQSAGRPFAEYSVRNRIYSSTTGRWTSVDPYWPSQLPYNYAESSPMTQVDPSGLWSSFCCGQKRTVSQNFKNSAGPKWGITDIDSTVYWQGHQGGASQGFGPVTIKWEEKSNVLPTYYPKAWENRWIDATLIGSTSFSTLAADQASCLKNGCPTTPCNGNSSDHDDPTYLYDARYPVVRCACFRLTVFSTCDSSATVYKWSQTVSFQFVTQSIFVPLVHAPSDHITDSLYCSQPDGTPCPQTPR